MRTAAVLIAIFFCCFVSLSQQQDATWPADVQALKNLAANWNSAALTTLWNGLTTDPCFGKWKSITCTSNLTVTLNGTTYENVTRVTGIAIEKQQLNGTLPTELYGLTALQKMSFKINNLSGPISDYKFYVFSNLSTIILRGNSFTGSVPLSYHAQTLVSLDMSENKFTGPVPSGLLNGNNYPALQELYLAKNALSRGLPQPFDSQLVALDISENFIAGVVPNINSTTMPNIQVLHLDDNQFSIGHGNINNLTTLTFLTMSRNPVKTLVGTSFLTGFPKLFQFMCASCMLTDAVLEDTVSPTLQYISLQQNNLTAGLPPGWGNSNLEWIYLSHNQLTGGIPEQWGQLLNTSARAANSKLRFIDVSYNNLIGGFPSWLKDLPSGFAFEGACNQFSGDLPEWCLDTGDCTSCDAPAASASPVNQPGGDGDDGHKAYLWFLVIPGLLFCILFGAITAYMVHKHRLSKAGYESVHERF